MIVSSKDDFNESESSLNLDDDLVRAGVEKWNSIYQNPLRENSPAKILEKPQVRFEEI